MSTSGVPFQFKTGSTIQPPPTGKQLDPCERQQVEELERRDAEVRQHEMAHLAAAGPYATGGPNYT